MKYHWKLTWKIDFQLFLLAYIALHLKREREWDRELEWEREWVIESKSKRQNQIFIYKFIINNIKHASTAIIIVTQWHFLKVAYRFFRGSQNLSKSYVLIVWMKIENINGGLGEQNSVKEGKGNELFFTASFF